MPKPKKAHCSALKAWLNELGENKKYFRIDDNKLFCEACLKLYDFDQISQIKQHIKTKLHIKSTLRHDFKLERQQWITDNQAPSSNPFYEDLTRAFLAADIPWIKLSNPIFRDFFEKHMHRTLPDESTLRKHYVKSVYLQSIEKIREDIGNCPIWISVDETTDALGRFVANVLVGALQKDRSSPSHLLMCKRLEKTNSANIFQLILDACKMMWPTKTQCEIADKFLLFLTDGVAYMVKTGKDLKALYPNLLHVTCLAHGLNLVVEEVRSHYNDIDKMVGQCKAIFRKSPSRIVKFKEMCPELPLPPSPVYTRWGTWLEAVEFYAENFEQVKLVVDSLNSKDAKCIEICKEEMSKKEIQTKLAYLSANFTILAKTLTKIQESNLSLSESIAIVTETKDQLKKVKGEIGKEVYKKFKSVLNKNSDFAILQKVSGVINGENTEELPDSISPAKAASLMYAPITSVDAERSFSMHKALINKLRLSTTMENVEMALVSHYALSIV